MLLTGAAAAKPRPVASGVDEGSMPHAIAGGWIDQPRQAPRIEVLAQPSSPTEINLIVQCFRGSHRRSFSRELALQVPPVSQRIKLPLRSPDECHIDADAQFEDFELTGRIAIRIFR